MSTGSESSGEARLAARRVTEAEADQVTEVFTLAFHEDPTWSWAFPDPDKRMGHHRLLWGLYMHSAVPYGWVWMTEDGGAASLWIPPGAPELSDEDEAKVEPLLRRLLSSLADDVHPGASRPSLACGAIRCASATDLGRLALVCARGRR